MIDRQWIETVDTITLTGGCRKMKRILTGGLFAVLLAGLMGGSAWGAPTSSVSHRVVEDGTRTVRWVLDTDSLSDIGSNYLDDSAAVTPWVEMPVGINFAAFVTPTDADSSIAWVADTLHVILQTAPHFSFAVDTSGTIAKFVRWKNSIINLWETTSVGFADVTQMAYFSKGEGFADLVADTAAGVGGSDNATQARQPHNLGNLRWLIHHGTADMVTDGPRRLSFFVVWHQTQISDGRSYGLRAPESIQEYAYIAAGLHWIEGRF